MTELQEDDDLTLNVGSVKFKVRNGRTTSSVDGPATASGIVDADDLAESGADWGAPAEAAHGSYVMMSGEVVEGTPADDGSVALSLQSALMLSETFMPAWISQNLTPGEFVHAAATSAGFTPGRLDIHGLDTLPTEPMWVLAAVDGVRVRSTVRVGVVEFIGEPVGREMLQRFSPALEPKFTEPLDGASAFARVAVVANLPYDAERDGLALIDVAIAWLTTRLRYAWSHMPCGGLQHYERAPTRVTVTRRDGVGVLAVDGDRRWWRNDTTVRRSSGEVELGVGTRWMEPTMPAEVEPGDRQALLALQRAVTASDSVQRVGALWEAIEFYVGKRNPPKLFDRDEVGAIIERAASGLTEDRAARVDEVLRQFLNQPPLIPRLEYVLAEEGVPVTDDDRALLGRLRGARNKALHGSAAASEHEDIDRAIAFMSRALTTRLHRAAG
jgi:hypothetical protein